MNRNGRMYAPDLFETWIPHDPQPNFLDDTAIREFWDTCAQRFGQLNMEEFERQLNEMAATMQRDPVGTVPRKKKIPPKKDWDERITSEDTKELDEFLNSLARKSTLESAT